MSLAIRTQMSLRVSRSIPQRSAFRRSGLLEMRAAISCVATGFHSVDFSVFRNFAFTERWKLQFRAEAVNSFNHVNYQGPVVNINSTPGAFVAAAQPRIIQFGLKLSF